MLEKYKGIKNNYNKSCNSFHKNISKLDSAITEMQDNANRVLGEINTIDEVFDDIYVEFSEKTGILNKKDLIFLWTAVALQCLRWIMIPTLDEKTLAPDVSDRKDSGEEGKKDPKLDSRRLKEIPDNLYELPTAQEILDFPVPYDATEGTEFIWIPGLKKGEYAQLNGVNHHSATLGHDPIIGFVFGPMNIMTRSITFQNARLINPEEDSFDIEKGAFCLTMKVAREGGTQWITEFPPYSFSMMVADVIRSVSEDPDRLKNALEKHRAHMLSDKNTKKGLPIPFINPEKKQKMLNKNWNSKELEKIAKGAMNGIKVNYFWAEFISTCIEIIHSFMYNPEKDGDYNIYLVRTKRILAISSIIAESLNIVAVAAGVLVGVLSGVQPLTKKAVSHIDIGGYIHAIHQIAINSELQGNIRKEFLEEKLYERIVGDNYSFLYEGGGT